MLHRFFLKSFYSSFFVSIAIIVPILGIGDLLFRLASFPSYKIIPYFLLMMLPLMSSIAMPLACALAVSLAVVKLLNDSTLLTMRFFEVSIRVLIKSVVIFALTLSILYVPLVVDWVPRSYLGSKRLLFNFAKKHLDELSSARFHRLGNISIFFKEKTKSAEGFIFSNLLVLKHDKGKEGTIFIAKEGVLRGWSLELHDGTVLTRSDGKEYVATMEKADIDMENILGDRLLGDGEIERADPKFLSFTKLIADCWESYDCFLELHIRIIRILWQVLFPLLSLAFMLKFGRIAQSNLMLAISSCATMSLFFYILLGVARMLVQSSVVALTILYLAMVAVGSFSFITFSSYE